MRTGTLLWRDRYHAGEPDGTQTPMHTGWATQILINTAVQTSRAIGSGIIAASIRHANAPGSAAHLEIGVYASPTPGSPVLGYALHSGPHENGPRQTRITRDPAVHEWTETIAYRYDNDQETTLPLAVQIRITALFDLIDSFRTNPNNPGLPSTYVWTSYPLDPPTPTPG